MTRGMKRCMMLHAPNNKLRNACHENSLNSWREQFFASLWKLATYIANLPRDRRVIRVLEGSDEFRRGESLAHGKMVS